MFLITVNDITYVLLLETKTKDSAVDSYALLSHIQLLTKSQINTPLSKQLSPSVPHPFMDSLLFTTNATAVVESLLTLLMGNPCLHSGHFLTPTQYILHIYTNSKDKSSNITIARKTF